MWQRLYFERQKRDLQKWIDRGWVTPENAQSILADMGTVPNARYVPQVLTILGAVLVGFAAMSFVAANWATIPKIMRLAMLFTLMWSAWGAAAYCDRRGLKAYAEAGVTAGLALFGANIMLIAQIYHVTSSTPTWLLVWTLAALAAALSLSSRAALAISLLLATLWTAWAVDIRDQIHWGFLAPWAGAIWLTSRLGWRPGLHLGLLALCVWVPINADALIDLIKCSDGQFTALLMFPALFIWIMGLRLSTSSSGFGPILENWGMVIAFCLFWTLQVQSDDSPVSFIWMVLAFASIAGIAALAFGEVSADRLALRDYIGLIFLGGSALVYPAINDTELLKLLIYATLFLVMTVWLIAYGTNRGNRFALNGGLIAFTGECLYLYFQTLGTLLNTAAFFALGGIILIAGSILLPRIRRRLVANVSEGDAP